MKKSVHNSWFFQHEKFHCIITPPKQFFKTIKCGESGKEPETVVNIFSKIVQTANDFGET